MSRGNHGRLLRAAFAWLPVAILVLVCRPAVGYADPTFGAYAEPAPKAVSTQVEKSFVDKLTQRRLKVTLSTAQVERGVFLTAPSRRGAATRSAPSTNGRSKPRGAVGLAELPLVPLQRAGLRSAATSSAVALSSRLMIAACALALGGLFLLLLHPRPSEAA